jgi:hypothetical protein
MVPVGVEACRECVRIRPRSSPTGDWVWVGAGGLPSNGAVPLETAVTATAGDDDDDDPEEGC